MNSKSLIPGRDDWEGIRMYRLSYKTDEGIRLCTDTAYPADIYIELMDAFGCEDFAMEMQEWCELAEDGSHFEDDDIIIDCHE